MPEASYGRANRWLSVFLIDPSVTNVTPEDVRQAAERLNIECRPVWKPMHQQPVFKGTSMTYITGSSDDLFETGLCLPSGTAMSSSELDMVISCVQKELRNRGG
jgi:dTDP-4-amino-4,6-dideoxygalactose transaminase